jgi:hypothetical protein
MKRFIGLTLTIVGAGIALWGGVCVLTGTSETRIMLPEGVSVNALTAGLIGLGVFVVGLVWVRD